MLFIPIVIGISIILGYLRKGSLKNIERIEFKNGIFIFIGFLLQIVIFSSKFQSSNLKNYTGILFIVSYLLVLITILSNLHIKSMKAIGLGFLLNFLVIVLNGGYIPVSVKALQSVGAYGKIELLKRYTRFNNCVLMGKNTNLNFLGDIIPIPLLKQVISIGDIFILLGFFLIIQEGMLTKRSWGIIKRNGYK